VIARAVIKVGGRLASDPDVLRRIGRDLAQLAGEVPLVVVPGGGPFADAVRQADRRHGLPPSTAHWMAIHGMDQYAELLAAIIPGSEIVRDGAGVVAARQRGAVPVLAPSSWLRAADELPHSWEVTSDSLAAYLAGLLGAERLLLVKAVGGAVDGLVDPWFRRALPAGVACRAVVPAELPAAARWLRGDPAE
jgi:aspartokinase-like uncharacterized kinase